MNLRLVVSIFQKSVLDKLERFPAYYYDNRADEASASYQKGNE